ncbi:CD97 antigen [Bagarius yarrelli]|uniref:Thromboxane A2 receptor n=1 Tax=Bagarius yarrelli TaxID=175774 RepID=A0A556V8V4_BAGYA|nr:CD97 antigen [Bagarius yarrelli]
MTETDVGTERQEDPPVRFRHNKRGIERDSDECEETVCGENAVCLNTEGSYYCQCEQGYKAGEGVNFTADEGKSCQVINKCLENEHICGPSATCFYSIGGYYCECNSGFVASNKQKQFNASQNVTCDDVNECVDCGPNSTCTKTNVNSYLCSCHSGFVASNMRETFTVKEEVYCNELKCGQLDAGHLSVQVPVELQEILDELKSTCMQKGATGEEMLQIVIDALEGFRLKTSFTDTKLLGTMLELVEVTLPLIGQLLVNGNISQSSPQTHVEMLVTRQRSPPLGRFTLSTNHVQFSSDWKTAVGDSYQGFAAAALFEYTDLKIPHGKNTIIRDSSGAENPAYQFRLNSRVVTIEEAVGNISCVFWDSALKGGFWSNKGCNVVTSSADSTVCSCKHLSSFAVLMALYEQKDVFELQLITWIGLSISLICLLICILTFWLVRSIQSTRTIIHLHFCISLFIADFIFLVGISQTQNQAGCAVVAALLHYFFLAVFCWMCLEGVQLFRMVVLVFNTTLNRGYLMAAGYGVPALIVIISASVNYKGYGTPRYCWLNLENGFIWSFFGPVCVIIVVNAVFFLITVSKLAQKFNSLNPDFSSLRKLKTFTITAVAQLCVLGTMWVFGCFQFDEGMLVMSYLFTILNSFQGFLVFVMHCLLSKQVRDEYIRFLTCLTTRPKSSYSEFSTNQSSKSQVRSVHLAAFTAFPVTMDFVFTSFVPTTFQDMNLSFFYLNDPNSTSPSPLNPPNFGMSYFTMTFGVLSNLIGLAIVLVSYARFHHRAKTPFLLLAATLLMSDLAGHLVTGAFALHLHLGKVRRQRAASREASEPPQVFCKLFGACMVFFGLTPLLLGSAMAVERCLGITQPLQHSALATTAHVRLCVFLLMTVALSLAALPLLNVGTYEPQFPGTWCFLPVHGALSSADAGLALTFSSLGLVALTVSVLCNTVSGLTLLQARLHNQGANLSSYRRRKSSMSSVHSLDVEMMVQLAVITVVSSVCWSPFLIYVFISVRQFYSGNRSADGQYEQLLLLGLRMASWNQILDPWVYILLRRAVLRRVCHLLWPSRVILSQSSSCRSSERQEIHMH